MMKKLILGVVALMALTFTACEDDEDPTLFTAGFDANGGTYISFQIIEDGDTIVTPENPENQNATFAGWYLNDSAYDFSSIVIEDIILVAKWTITDDNLFTAGFDANGGTYISSQIIENGDTVVIPENPENQNSTFAGWYLNDSVYDFSSIVIEDITLVAKWTITDGNMRIDGFEDVLLNENGLAQNDNISGSIASGDLNVTCTWASGYASGFTVNNHKNNTTAGWSNPYSSSAANGAYQSENYATFYKSSDSIKFNSLVDLESVMLCNNTYAYLSMLNGDDYAKKFVAEDYFMLTLELYGVNGTKIGTEDFYLADFRNGKTVIVKEWTKLDLSTFTSVSYIKFSFESTDNGDYGMNTPAYFCIDNIAYYEAK